MLSTNKARASLPKEGSPDTRHTEMNLEVMCSQKDRYCRFWPKSLKSLDPQRQKTARGGGVSVEWGQSCQWRKKGKLWWWTAEVVNTLHTTELNVLKMNCGFYTL